MYFLSLESCEISGMYNHICFLFLAACGYWNPVDRFLSYGFFLQALLLHRVRNTLPLCSRTNPEVSLFSYVWNLAKLQGCIILYVSYFLLPEGIGILVTDKLLLWIYNTLLQLIIPCIIHIASHTKPSSLPISVEIYIYFVLWITLNDTFSEA